MEGLSNFPYDWPVGGLVGRSVGHNFLKGLEVTLTCSYRRTFFNALIDYDFMSARKPSSGGLGADSGNSCFAATAASAVSNSGSSSGISCRGPKVLFWLRRIRL